MLEALLILAAGVAVGIGLYVLGHLDGQHAELERQVWGRFDELIGRVKRG